MHIIYKSLFTLVFLSFIGPIFAQSTGELSISVATSETGGNYAPKHVVAIWIENDQGNFIKTLLAYAATRKTHLNTWQASTNDAGTEYNTVDAITGATQYSHQTRVCSWDGTDYIGNEMPDGDYTVWMELTDKNATGNYSSFSFVKGPRDTTITPDDVPSFSDIQINWTADQTSIIDESDIEMKISSNPGNGIFQIVNASPGAINVFNLAGKIVTNQHGNQIDISDQPKGIYLIKIQSIAKTFKYIKSK